MKCLTLPLTALLVLGISSWCAERNSAQPEPPPPPPLAKGGIQGGLPANSSAIIIDQEDKHVYVVNADSGSITMLDAATHKKLAEVPVGRDPRTLAIARGGKLLVANMLDDSVSVLATPPVSPPSKGGDTGGVKALATLSLPDEPYGVVSSPAADLAFVSCSGTGVICFIDTAALKVVGKLTVPPHPRGLAISADGKRLYVTHFLTGQVSVVDIAQRKLLTTIATGADSNMAQHMVINPSGTRAYLPHIRSNVATSSMLFDTIVFPVVSVIDLALEEHRRKEKIGLDAVDRPVNMPFAAAFSPDGRRLFVVNSGSDDLSIIDLEDGTNPRQIGHVDVGGNPRGIVLTADGTKAFVANHVANEVAVVDARAMKVVDRVTVTDDKRPAAVQRGQALFFSSARPELSRDRWIACASCHFDGGIDGRTWNTPRGPRNTQALFGVNETHPLHWSADRASVQDFQKTIQSDMGGKGLSTAELDDLAAFVNSLRLPPNPFRDAGGTADGSLSPAARRGQQVFESPKTQCAACHPAPLTTDRKLHDVGTGGGVAEKMGSQFDTPSLRGIYATAPYLHDGSAATLRDVLIAKNAKDRHGVTSHLSAQEVQDLIAFLLSQ